MAILNWSQAPAVHYGGHSHGYSAPTATYHTQPVSYVLKPVAKGHHYDAGHYGNDHYGSHTVLTSTPIVVKNTKKYHAASHY